MDSQKLIKYRTALMGISALAVVACHFHSYLASGIIGRFDVVFYLPFSV